MNTKLLLALALAGAMHGQSTPPSIPPDVIYPVIRIPPDAAALIRERDDLLKLNSLKAEMSIVAIEAGIDSTVRLREFYQIAIDQFGKTPGFTAAIKHNLQECDDRIVQLRKVIEALKSPVSFSPVTLTVPLNPSEVVVCPVGSSHPVEECDKSRTRRFEGVPVPLTPEVMAQILAPDAAPAPIGGYSKEIEAVSKIMPPAEHTVRWMTISALDDENGRRTYAYEFGLRSDGCVVWRERK